MDKLSDTVIGVLTYNDYSLTRRMLESMLSTEAHRCKVVIYDNSSRHDIARQNELFAAGKADYIKSEKNEGFAGGVNSLVSVIRKRYDPEYIGICNQDIFLDEGWLEKLLSKFDMDNAIATVSPLPKVEGLQWYIESGNGDIDDRASAPFFCFVVRADVLDISGLFDPDYFCYWEDADFCWRLILMGYRVVVSKDVLIYHEKGAAGKKMPGREITIMRNQLTTFMKYMRFSHLMTIFPIVLVRLARIFSQGGFGAFLEALEELCRSFPASLKKRREKREIRMSPHYRRLRYLIKKDKQLMIKHYMFQNSDAGFVRKFIERIRIYSN
jgi:GT2 family glycosyltransferase